MDAQFKVRVVGEAALILHNSRKLANPLHPLTKSIKEITSKRKKTDEDYAQLYRLEWEGGMYWNEKDGPHIPGEVFQAAIIEGAKISRLGSKLERGFLVLQDACPLEYSGPRDLDGMYSLGERFVDIRSVGVNNSRCMRARPYFREWAFEATLIFDSLAVNKGDLETALTNSGRLTGLCDYRPRYGKFSWSEVAK